MRRADPDVLVAFPCGFPLERVEEEAAAILPSLPGWRDLAAVRAGRVYLAEANQYFNRPGPRLAETLEILAEMLHPGVFAVRACGLGLAKARSRTPLEAP